MAEPELVGETRKVWEKVKEDYESEIINSERCLQAALYYHFRKQFKKKYEIFVEPTFQGTYKRDIKERFLGELEGKIPDFIIVKDREIIAVIEIKSKPHYHVKYILDFEKFLLCYQVKDKDIYVKIGKEDGELKENPFKITNKTIFVFLAITKKVPILNNEELSELNYNLEEKTYMGYIKVASNKIECELKKIKILNS